jgi:hypothetical protein
MEVHHPHHPIHKKKWSEYIIEFIMLFTAVTLGFFAENLRESKVEKERSNELVSSFIKDVKKNVVVIDSLIKADKRVIYKADSAVYYIITTKDQIDLQVVYGNLLDGNRFLSNNDTYEQMKNSGSLRYIKDTFFLKKIIDYSNNVKAAEFRSATQEYEYTSHEFINTINKYLPPEISSFRHTSPLLKYISFDSTQLDLFKKLNGLSKGKAFLLNRDKQLVFRNEIVPVILRHTSLISTSLYFKNKTRESANDLLTYYHLNMHE